MTTFQFRGKAIKSPTKAFLFGGYAERARTACLVWVEEGKVQQAETLTFEEVGQLAGGN